ncbi:polysaccharide biosynthesis protein GumE [Sphingomonas sp. ac-8]|uniref:polysaccharide biosynthesis protein GumE n=1 Tax=Sphingomonas sp. ac-8 TaxID=3242977 RepID=UPI003A7FDAB9
MLPARQHPTSQHPVRQHPAAERPAVAPAALRLRRAALAVLWLAVLFNIALAWVNAQLLPIGGTVVVAMQGMVMALALAVGLLHRRGGWRRWVGMLAAAAMLWLLLCVVRQSIELRFLGDAVLIPAFALLGTCLAPRDLLRWLVAAQWVIGAGAAWELVQPASFAGTFNVTGYYVNTRGLAADSFWSEGGEGLFLNVERPTGRNLLPSTGFNRATSVFLEPVSLGNWTSVVLIVLVLWWGRMGRGTRALLIASDLFLLFACDGRFALVCAAGILLGLPFGRWAPRGWPLVYLPAMIATLFALRAAELLPRGGDTFAGRLRKGVDYLGQLRLADLLGAQPGAQVYANADAGWAYLLQSQSLIGFLAFWLLPVLMARERSSELRRFANATAIYFALCMPISYSFVSIKTVAVVFALFGCLLAAAHRPVSATGLSGLPIHPRAGRARSQPPRAPRPAFG